MDDECEQSTATRQSQILVVDLSMREPDALEVAFEVGYDMMRAHCGLSTRRVQVQRCHRQIGLCLVIEEISVITRSVRRSF